MPRRKDPLLPKGQIVVGDACSPADIAGINSVAQTSKAVSGLPPAKRKLLLEEIATAVAFARGGERRARDGSVTHERNGLGHWLHGKDVKPVAWGLDVFVRDVVEGWKKAKLKPTIRDDNAGRSEFLDFINELAKQVGLAAGRNSLVNNAKRGKRIVRLR